MKGAKRARCEARRRSEREILPVFPFANLGHLYRSCRCRWMAARPLLISYNNAHLRERAANSSLGRDEARRRGQRLAARPKAEERWKSSQLVPSVVRFNFPRFASEPLNALQAALLPIHFLAPFPPRFRGDQRVTMPFSYPRRDRARIDRFDISTDSNARCARVTEGKCQRHTRSLGKAALVNLVNC